MNIRLKAISFLLCWCATGALGQNWIVYAPPEKDFSALFPAPPARAAEADGAVAFSATAENITFIVYRRDPRLQPIGSPVVDIPRRLRAGHRHQGSGFGDGAERAGDADQIGLARDARFDAHTAVCPIQ